jgi:hypothetical protein
VGVLDTHGRSTQEWLIFKLVQHFWVTVFGHELHQVPGGSRSETRLLAVVARFFSKKSLPSKVKTK